MPPVLTIFTFFVPERSNGFLSLSQRVFVAQRDFEFFWRVVVEAVQMSQLTSAGRSAESAKSAIFDEYPKKNGKNEKKSKFFILAENGRFDSNLLKTLHLGPKDPILIYISCQFIFYDFLWYFEFWSFLTFFWKKYFFSKFRQIFEKNIFQH